MLHKNLNQIKRTKLLKRVRKNIKRLLSKINTPRGWALLAAVFFFFILSAAAIMNIVVTNATQLNNAVFFANKGVAENLALNTASPIRRYIVDEMYYRIQQELIDHMNKSAGSTSYICQDTLTPPTSVDPASGSLNSQFGLCDPVNMFGGMLGNSNQSIDYLKLFPNYTKTFENRSDEIARQAIINQTFNKFRYTLRTTYIGEQLVQPAIPGDFRTEKYLWSVRADVESNTVGDIQNGLVMYFDVTLTNVFFPTDFPGAGSACDQKEASFQCGRPGDEGCGSIIVGIIGPDGKPQPVLNPDPNDPENIRTGPCTPAGCPISGGRLAKIIPGKGIRPQFGCASPRTGQRGTTGLDPFGYNFSLAVRLVSIGSTYN